NAGFHWPSRIAHCQLNCRGKDWARTSLRNNGQCGIGDGQCQSANLTPLALKSRAKPESPLTRLRKCCRIYFSKTTSLSHLYLSLPTPRRVDDNPFLGQPPLAQAWARSTSSDPPASSERSFKRGGDGFGPIVDANLTAFDVLQPLPDVADRYRDDRQIASQ